MLRAPSRLNLFDGGPLGALADGDHDHERAHADDDAQGGEDGAQLVQAQVLQAQAEGFKQEVPHRRNEYTKNAAAMVFGDLGTVLGRRAIAFDGWGLLHDLALALGWPGG